MDKILISINLNDDKNLVTVLEDDLAESEVYNREEIIELLRDIAKLLTNGYKEKDNGAI